MDSTHEAELWEKCGEGDIEAREELIVSYRPLVYWIASKIHVNDREIKQDMIQEGLLALIKAVDKFEPSRGFKFSTYAWHKIHGQIVNFLERSVMRAPMPMPDEYLTESDYDNSEDGDRWLDASKAVSQLEGNEAEIVSALYFEGKEPKEIAGEKRMDLSHVYRLRRRAIAKMRNILGLEGI